MLVVLTAIALQTQPYSVVLNEEIHRLESRIIRLESELKRLEEAWKWRGMGVDLYRPLHIMSEAERKEFEKRPADRE